LARQATEICADAAWCVRSSGGSTAIGLADVGSSFGLFDGSLQPHPAAQIAPGVPMISVRVNLNCKRATLRGSVLRAILQRDSKK
jgi:hypothetical protein